MPTHIRLLARYGNGIAVLFFGFIAVVGFGHSIGMALFGLAMAGLAGFNIHVAEKAARLLSEEEWLAAEIRKAELRKRLAEMERGMAPPPAIPMQLPGPQP